MHRVLRPRALHRPHRPAKENRRADAMSALSLSRQVSPLLTEIPSARMLGGPGSPRRAGAVPVCLEFTSPGSHPVDQAERLIFGR